MPLPPIQYLRWARSRALDPATDHSLILSGMRPPDPSMFGSLDPTRLLVFDDRDRPALARRIASDLGCPLEELWLQPGTHGALLALLAARLAEHPGPVVVEDPAYEPLRRIPEFLGAELLRLPRPRSLQFQLDWDALEALRPRRPSLLLLTQPHNPSGAILDLASRRRLVEWAADCGCALLSDEVYLEFAEDPPGTSLRPISPAVMKVGSFTKVMGLGALRVSWCEGPPEWLQRAADFSDYGAVAIAAPSQLLAEQAWSQRELLFARARDAARSGRALVGAWLEAHEHVIDAFLPEAGIICFPRPSAPLHRQLVRLAADSAHEAYGFGLDGFADASQLWIRELARSERVHLTPGAFFEDPMAFRLGFGIPAESLREALGRLDRFVARAKESA